MAKDDGDFAGLSKPAKRALAAGGYSGLEDLAGVREAEVAALHGMGPKGVRLLREKLAARGLQFRA